MRAMTVVDYPEFKANQILSHDELNRNFTYLNEQGLLTRANVIGTGIICGLNVSFKNNKICISRGCGITSEGHYVYIEDEEKQFGYIKNIEYTFSGGSRIPDVANGRVLELLTSGNSSEMISEDHFKNNAVVLVYEKSTRETACGSCGNANYQSKQVTIEIKALLVPNSLIRNGIDQEDRTISPSVMMERITQLLPSYTSNSNVLLLVDEIYNHRLLKNILLFNNTVELSRKIKELKSLTGFNYYNFLIDLTEAYEEFREFGERILNNYRPSESQFSCHLILTEPYRHSFRPSIDHNGYDELNRLWKRIGKMIEYFNPDIEKQETETRLTPSVYGAVPLAHKAVPYYYWKAGQKFNYNIWTCRKDDAEGIGYWYDDKEKKHYGYYHEDNVTNYDLERYNFLRIEGHINVNIESTFKEITNKVISYNLPVSVIKIPFKVDSSFISRKEIIFNALLSLANNDFEKILFWNTEGENLKEKAEKAKEEAKEAQKAAEKAQKAAEKAQEAAEATPPKIEDVKKQAVAAVTKADNATLILIAPTAANKVKTAANAAQEAAEATPPKIEDVKKQAAVAVTEAEEAVKQAATAAEAAEAILAIIGRPLKDHLDDFVSSMQNYGKVISFACNNAKECMKLIAFADWMTDSCQEYKINKAFSSFKFFRAQHPGTQHKSGVPIGGTFILVHDGGKVVADFCLPYRVTQPA